MICIPSSIDGVLIVRNYRGIHLLYLFVVYIYFDIFKLINIARCTNLFLFF